MKSFVLAALLAAAVSAFAADQPQPAPGAPREFVDQALEPTGGKIKRPKDWFFTADHGRTSYAWILSREDAAKDHYTTGMRVQEMVSVHAATGQTPREFAAEFIAARKKAAAKIVKSSDEEKRGAFTRVRFETEEGKAHIAYTVYWGDEHLDVVAVVTAGTDKELWATYAPVFETMGDFQLLDIRKYEKAAAPDDVEVAPGQLTGHWRYTDDTGGVTSDYTFAADGTFTANIVQHGKVSWEWAGKWSLDGNVLHYEFTKSSLAQLPAGTKDSDKVVEVAKDYYVILPGDGHKRKFERVP